MSEVTADTPSAACTEPHQERCKLIKKVAASGHSLQKRHAAIIMMPWYERHSNIEMNREP